MRIEKAIKDEYSRQQEVERLVKIEEEERKDKVKEAKLELDNLLKRRLVEEKRLAEV